MMAVIPLVEDDPYCQPNQAIELGLYHTELVYNNYTDSYLLQVKNDPYCQPIKGIDQGQHNTELVTMLVATLYKLRMTHIVNQSKLLIKDYTTLR